MESSLCSILYGVLQGVAVSGFLACLLLCPTPSFLLIKTQLLTMVSINGCLENRPSVLMSTWVGLYQERSSTVHVYGQLIPSPWLQASAVFNKCKYSTSVQTQAFRLLFLLTAQKPSPPPRAGVCPGLGRAA